MEKKMLDMAKKSLFIILCSLVSSVSYNIFIIPHKLLSGGVSGISLIIQYLSGIPAGYFIILLNIPLFILSIKELNKDFTFLTILGTVSQSVFLILTRNVSHYLVINDILVSCIYGGVINGLAFGAVFSNQGSLGGTDIISMILRRRYNLDIGKISFAINILIVSIGSVFFGVERGLYTLISMYIVGSVIDKVIKGFNKRNLLLIVSDKVDLINEKIQDELKRTSTLLYGEGGYTKQQRKVIYCVVSLSQLPKIKHIVESTDPYAFMSILDTAEVQGKGFKNLV